MDEETGRFCNTSNYSEGKEYPNPPGSKYANGLK